jgi:hypothetical protein
MFNFLIIFSIILSAHAWADFKPFPQYIDYQKFAQLSRHDQRDFLVSLMQTIAQMDQELIDSGKYQKNVEIQKNISKKRAYLEKVHRIFDQLSQQMFIAEATAAANDTRYCSKATLNFMAKNKTNKTCMYGSYMSTMSTITENGKKIDVCVRPACSHNPKFREAHNKAAVAANCNGASMACNPALFGFKKESNGSRTKASCVRLDYPSTGPNVAANANSTVNVVAHNASLACLMEVMAEPETDRNERLDQIANNIIQSSDNARAFNQMLHIITNICICGDTAFDNPNGTEVARYLDDVDKNYAKYMNGHRTCNSLLNQTALVVDKVVALDGQCTQQLMPPTLADFTKSINEFRTFSTKAETVISDTKGARGKNLDPNNIQNRRDAMWYLRARTVSGLDNIASYEDLISKGNDPLKNKWCPLEFPDPEAFKCKVLNIQAKKVTASTASINAEVKVFAGSRTEGAVPKTAVKWKIAGVDITGQATSSLSVADQAIAPGDNSIELSASFSEDGKQYFCQEKVTMAALPSNDIESCSVKKEARGSIDENGKLSIAADSSFVTLFPDGCDLKEGQKIVFFFNGIASDLKNLEISDNDIGPFKFSAKIMEGDTVLKECGEGEASVADEEPLQCKVENIKFTPNKTETEDPVESKGNLSATLVVTTPADFKLNEGEEIEWSFTGKQGEIKQGLNLSVDDVPEAPVMEVSAVLRGVVCAADYGDDDEGGDDNGDDEKKEAECNLSITNAPGSSPGMYSIQASVSGAVKPEEAAAFAGIDGLQLVEGSLDTAEATVAGLGIEQKKTITAEYTVKGTTYKCSQEHTIPRAQGQAPVGSPQGPNQPMLPQAPNYNLQFRGVN